MCHPVRLPGFGCPLTFADGAYVTTRFVEMYALLSIDRQGRDAREEQSKVRRSAPSSLPDRPLLEIADSTERSLRQPADGH